MAQVCDTILHGFDDVLAERILIVVPVRRSGRNMPVTAKFSEKFYSQLGHDVADELIEWFNKVDATYHADLRELNELNFARFDARLEQRIAQVEQRIAQLETRLIRWMFLFWVGTVGTMIALLRFGA
jgi:hypothetical protein